MDDPITIAQPHYELYESFYKEINPSASSVISAGDAAAFLKKSNLSMQVLGQIWEFADYQKRGSLDKRGIFIAFKLVAAAQQGHPINSSSVFLPGLNPPSFASPTVTPLPQFNQNSAHSSLNQWAIDVADQVKYDSIFDSLCPVDGKLPGEKVRPVLLNSGLSPTSLAKIWELADQDKDGQLDRIEMTVALHLVYKTLQNDPIPFVLPPSLIHPSKAALSRRTSSLIAPPTCSAQNLTMSGSNEIILLSENHCYCSQPGTPVRSVSCSTPSSEEWFVDRLASASQFAACDTDSDGLVSGNDVKEVLLATGNILQIIFLHCICIIKLV
uniref:Epidermal growth factor receptor substrate 15-like 1 n=1 Tax=Heterorhabditis bacteriophora TaxID=37862 RepID=A0A1I7XIH8_HETBA